MAKNSSDNELFGATNLFNKVTKEFQEGIELKGHNRRLKCYPNSFIACKGTDFLFNLLKSKKEFLNKIQSRDQVLNLMNIFLKWGIIIKIYPTSNLYKFEDNKDLYTLGKSDEEVNQNITKEPVQRTISRSTNDLLNRNSIDKISLKTNRSTSIYRSFGKSTYNQIYQIQNTIKKTTSTIIKSTNHNVTKLTNHTLNKFNNSKQSSSNLVKKLNSFTNSRQSDAIKRSTSAVSASKHIVYKNTHISRQFNRSFNHQYLLEKENLVLGNDKRFIRNYSGHLNRVSFSNSSVNNMPINSQPVNRLPQSTFENLSTSINLNPSLNPTISLNSTKPVNNEFFIKCSVETEGNNILKFLNKLSDGFKKNPLKPANNFPLICSQPLSSSANISTHPIILNRNMVQYIPTTQTTNRICLMNPISSTCYNTLV